MVHIAAQKADLNLLKKLKESDCELNIRNKNGNNGWFQSHFYFLMSNVADRLRIFVTNKYIQLDLVSKRISTYQIYEESGKIENICI